MKKINPTKHKRTMELKKLIFIEETKTHYIFTIHLRFTPWPKWMKEPYTEIINCSRLKDFTQSFIISNGRSVFWDYQGLDKSINAILSTKSKEFNPSH